MPDFSLRNRFLLRLAEITRKHGIPRGVGRLLNFFFPTSSFSPSDTFEIEFDKGLRAQLFLGSHMERQIFFSGGYQGKNEKAIQKLLKPGLIAFDCGANIGSYALRMAKAVFPGGKVYAIEPHLPIVEKLRTNIRLSGLNDMIEIVSCAISDSCGKTALYYPPDDSVNQGNASLKQFASTWDFREISVTTIDDLIEEKGILRVDLIRADVQGHELQLLKGARKTISTHYPMFSLRNSILWPSQQKLNFDEICLFLSGFGYTAHFLSGTTFIPTSTEGKQPPFGNYLFLSNSHNTGKG